MNLTSPVRAARRLAVAALFVAGTAGTAAAQPSPLDFRGTGQVVTVRFLGFEAADRSLLSYQIGTTFNPSGAFTALFVNLGAGATPLGTQTVIGTVGADQFVFFRLLNETQAAVSGASNFTFYSGLASRNPDNRLHVSLGAGSGTPALGGGTYTQSFNFEDRSGVVSPTADFDYNDLRFEISATSVVPEPSTYMLMASGLLGLAGVARRRRRTVS